MRSTFLLSVAILITTAANGQKLLFKYDDAGNQVKRQICFGDCQDLEQRPVLENKSMEEITSEDLIEFSDAISYYPNPVREELYVKWTLINNKEVLSIDVFTINGQLLDSINVKEGETKRSISFSSYPVGNYLLLLNFNNGEQEALQIIKK